MYIFMPSVVFILCAHITCTFLYMYSINLSHSIVTSCTYGDTMNNVFWSNVLEHDV